MINRFSIVEREQARASLKSIERHIKALLERNLITHQGSKKTGGYYAK